MNIGYDSDSVIVCDYAVQSVPADIPCGGKVAKSSVGMIRIEYPAEEIDCGSAEEILGTVCSVPDSVLKDIFFPKCVLKEFCGPGFGIAGIRKIAKRPNGMLRCISVAHDADIADMKDALAEKGVTNIAESSPADVQSAESHVSAILEAIDRLKSEGVPVSYAFNVTADRPMEYAERIAGYGAGEICADIDLHRAPIVWGLKNILSVPIRVNLKNENAVGQGPMAKISRMYGADSIRPETADAFFSEICTDNITVPYRPSMPVFKSGGGVPADEDFMMECGIESSLR